MICPLEPAVTYLLPLTIPESALRELLRERYGRRWRTFATSALGRAKHVYHRRALAARARVETMLAERADGVIVIDTIGRVRYASATAARMLGVSAPDTLLMTALTARLAPFTFFDARGVQVSVDHLPLSQALQGSVTDEVSLRVQGAGHQPDRWWVVKAQPVHDAHGAIPLAVMLFTDITESRRTAEGKRQQQVYLDALHAVSLGLMRQHDPADVLHAIIARAGVLLDTPHGFISLVSDDGLHLTFAAGQGACEVIPEMPSLAKGEGLSGKVWQTGTPLYIPDYARWEHRPTGPHREHFHAALAVPLIFDTAIIGVLSLMCTEREGVFDEAAIAMLSRFGELAAIALDNARLYRETYAENQATQQTEERYASLFNGVSDVILIADGNGHYVDANPAALALLGYAHADLLPLTVPDIVVAPRDHTADEYQQFVRTGHWHGETQLRRADGVVITAEGHAAAIETAMGPLYVSILHDITDRKQVEETLRASEKRFRALIEHSADGIALFGPDYTIRYASPSTTRILGYTPEEIVHRSLFDLIHPDDRATVADRIAAGYGVDGTNPTRELRMRHKDGTYRWLEYVSTTLLDDPSVGAIVVNYRDISERKRIEETLWLHERAVAAATNGIVITDARLPDHPIIYSNEGFVRLTGYTAADSLGRNCRFLGGPGTDTETRAHIRHALAAGRTCKVVLRNYRKDGTPFWNELALSPVTDDGGTLTHFIGVQEDVSARVEAEAALRVSEARFRAQYQGIPIPTYTWQHIGDELILVDYNAAAETLTGGAVRKLVGTSVTAMYGDRPAIMQSLWDCATQQSTTISEISYELVSVAAHKEFIVYYAFVAPDFVMVHTLDVTERKAAEEALRASEAQLRAQYQGLPIPTFTWQRVGEDWLFIDYNDAANAITHGRIGLKLGMEAHEIYTDLPDFSTAFTECTDTGGIVERELTWTFADGESRDLAIRLVPIRSDLMIMYMEDVTQRKQAAAALRTSEQRFRALVEHSWDGVIMFGSDGLTSYASPSTTRILGYAPEELVGQSIEDMIHPDYDAERAERGAILIRGGLGARTISEMRVRHKDGSWCWLEIATTNLLDDPTVRGFVANFRDVGERKQHDARLIHDATHDVLTGLPNRSLLLARLQAQIDRADRETNYRFAVLFLDIDRFKYVNDSLGHLHGDQLLQIVARRLRPGLSRRATVARLGGDEFVVLIPGVSQSAAAVRVAEELQAVLAQPIALDGHAFVMTGSIGVVLSAAAYQRPEEMLRDADTAMYEAKQQGRARVALFNGPMHAKVTRAMRLEQELRQALDRAEFAVWYQPIVSLAGGELLGFEALVRWDKPGRGIVAPDEFIALAEETGLIGALDHWVLREACAQMQDWGVRFPGAAHLSLNVNLSGKDLTDPAIGAAILFTLGETGLSTGRLNVEITETAVIEHASLAVPMLVALRARGIGVHLDDFGTGYSSLTYLRNLPIDAVKIDRTFVRDAMEESGGAVLTGVVAIAHKLKLLVIAEGIETEGQAAHLRALGCDRGQGYLYARPLTAREVEERLSQGAQGLPSGT